VEFDRNSFETQMQMWLVEIATIADTWRRVVRSDVWKECWHLTCVSVHTEHIALMPIEQFVYITGCGYC